MTSQHPITPPSELVQQWRNAAPALGVLRDAWISTEAARWGADQELQACINFVYDNELCDPNFYNDLRTARRPKPLSLKELALESLKRFEESGEFFSDQMCELGFIRKALETIND
jgi:hypothetical protein